MASDTGVRIIAQESEGQYTYRTFPRIVIPAFAVQSGCSSLGFHGDLDTERLQAADVMREEPSRPDVIEIVAAELAIRHPVPQDVVGGDQDTLRDDECGFLRPRRREIRRNCADTYVSLARVKAHEHSTSAVRNHLLPRPVCPLWRLPALS